ncbi:MAG: ROK family glucokinase [Bacillus sp. (in: firmicutes)]
MKQCLLGVDLGGTTIKLAFVNLEGVILHKWEIPTDLSDGGDYITRDIARTIQEKATELGYSIDHIAGIGIGAPGPVDARTGMVYEAVNLGWKEYPLREELAEATGLPVIVENDANIAALGEMWKGAGAGAQDLVCVTLGTGVGGGVIVNGGLATGCSGAAGEIGHMAVILEGGYPCNCGKTGCLETVASATGIVRLAMENLHEHPGSSLAACASREGVITAKDVAVCAQEGDFYAASVLEQVSYYLGYALANVANVLNPEKIVIGGGVSKAGDVLVEQVIAYFNNFAFFRVRESTEISIATLGNDAGIIGAAWLVKQKVLI